MTVMLNSVNIYEICSILINSDGKFGISVYDKKLEIEWFNSLDQALLNLNNVMQIKHGENFYLKKLSELHPRPLKYENHKCVENCDHTHDI